MPDLPPTAVNDFAAPISSFTSAFLEEIGERYGRGIINVALDMGVLRSAAIGDAVSEIIETELRGMLVMCRDKGLSGKQAKRFERAYRQGALSRVREALALLDNDHKGNA